MTLVSPQLVFLLDYPQSNFDLLSLRMITAPLISVHGRLLQLLHDVALHFCDSNNIFHDAHLFLYLNASHHPICNRMILHVSHLKHN